MADLAAARNLLSVICLNACWDWFQQAITRRGVGRKILKWMSNVFVLALRQRKKRIPSSGSLSWLSISTSAPIRRLQGQRRQCVSQPPRRAHPALIYQTECETSTHPDPHTSPASTIPKRLQYQPKKKPVGVNIRRY